MPGELEKRILSSETQIAGYRIQPYKPYTDIADYGNRFWSPTMPMPAVSDVLMTTAPLSRRATGTNPVRSTVRPMVLRNGAAPSRSDIGTRRR